MISETTEYIDPDVQQKHQLISRNGRVGGPGLGRQSAGLVHAVDASPSFLLDPLAFGTASGVGLCKIHSPMTAGLYWLWEDREEMYSLIHTFSHSFIQKMNLFICLLST